MTREDIIKMAHEAGLGGFLAPQWDLTEELKCFAALVAAAEREMVAQWMTRLGYATGHGDTIEDLLKELEWQIRERTVKECIRLCDQVDYVGADECIDAIREHFGVEE